MLTEFQIGIIVFIYGLCVGSFLNVCIFRIPESLSIIKPPSSCPKCKTPIKFFDNIPVLSYLILRGRCRACKTLISPRYPLTELFTGFLWGCTYAKFGFSIECLVYLVFISTLIVISLIDIDHRIIPDIISLPGIIFFFTVALILPGRSFSDALISSLLGILAGGGSLLFIAWAYEFITKNEGMGGGDIKLLAMIGALIGIKGVLFTVFASSAIGTLIGLLIMIITRNNIKLAIPFGPFLSAGAVLYLFFGQKLIHWYLNFSGFL